LFIDEADQFLWDLAAIPCLKERLECFKYPFKLGDICAIIETKLVALRSVCQLITTSQDVKRIFNGRWDTKNTLHVSGKSLIRNFTYLQ
jgi:hypothetical protein